MMRARLASVLFACTAIVGPVACGDSPTAPSPSPGSGSTRPGLLLVPGNYTLTFLVSQTQPTVPAGESRCRQNSLAAASSAIPVTVTQQGSSFRVKPVSEADLGFVAVLSSLADLYEGTASGRAIDPTSRVEVSVTPFPQDLGLTFPPNQLAPLPGDAASLKGLVFAEVEFSLGLHRRNCPVNEWRLEPR